jgi:hypothetical protein
MVRPRGVRLTARTREFLTALRRTASVEYQAVVTWCAVGISVALVIIWNGSMPTGVEAATRGVMVSKSSWQSYSAYVPNFRALKEHFNIGILSIIIPLLV